MRYRVLWVPAAEQELAALWMSTTDRRRLTQAAAEIDARLRYAADEQGEERSKGRRILLVPPLGVTFEVLPDDRIVRVLDAWRFEKRAKPDR